MLCCIFFIYTSHFACADVNSIINFPDNTICTPLISLNFYKIVIVTKLDTQYELLFLFMFVYFIIIGEHCIYNSFLLMNVPTYGTALITE